MGKRRNGIFLYLLVTLISLANCSFPPRSEILRTEYRPRSYSQYKNNIPKHYPEYNSIYYNDPSNSNSNDIPIVHTNDLSFRYTNDLPKVNPNKRLCPHSTICDSVHNYPKNQVEWHLENNPDHVEKLINNSDLVPITINRRIGIGDGDAGDTEMCKSRKEIIAPYGGLTKDNIWKHVFNNGEFGIEAVFCEKPGGSCEIRLPGLKMTCEQKYVYKVLVAVDGSGTTTDQFKVPSGCICKYKRA